MLKLTLILFMNAYGTRNHTRARFMTCELALTGGLEVDWLPPQHRKRASVSVRIRAPVPGHGEPGCRTFGDVALSHT